MLFPKVMLHGIIFEDVAYLNVSVFKRECFTTGLCMRSRFALVARIKWRVLAKITGLSSNEKYPEENSKKKSSSSVWT